MLLIFYNTYYFISSYSAPALTVGNYVLTFAESFVGQAATGDFGQEFLFLYPVINLMSSPSLYVKEAAYDLLSILGRPLINLLTAPKDDRIMEGEIPSISRNGKIFFRLLQHLWFQVCGFRFQHLLFQIVILNHSILFYVSGSIICIWLILSQLYF